MPLRRGDRATRRYDRSHFGNTRVYTLPFPVSITRRGKPAKLRAKQPLQSGRYKALTRLLRDRADELELSVRALATRLGKPTTTVHKTLRGQRRLDPIEFVEWCDALEIADPLGAIRSLARTSG